MSEAVALVVLGASLLAAIARWRWAPDWAVAAAGAVLLVAVGVLSTSGARSALKELGPTVGFLAALLVLADGCRRAGMFEALGALMARGSRGRPGRLLAMVFVVAAGTTAVLSLDATVVLLTPIVFATAARLHTNPRPHVYACSHLANSASLVLPVSNLTNLLAFRASGLAFTRFAALMALPWLAAIVVEYAIFRAFFRTDLAAPARGTRATGSTEVPVFTLVVLVLTLGGFVVTSFAGLSPAWAALAGALVLAARALSQRRTTPRRLVGSAGIPFCLFVLGLGIVVKAVVDNGLGSVIGRLLPGGDSLPALLAVVAVAAVLSNLINNLPAVLALLPVAAAGGPGPVLAVLIGVNLGPNLTYVGSLATLLWRRILHEHDDAPALGHFTRLGLLTVPATLVASTAALWAALHTIGG